jgi:hypothetical protein
MKTEQEIREELKQVKEEIKNRDGKGESVSDILGIKEVLRWILDE